VGAFEPLSPFAVGVKRTTSHVIAAASDTMQTMKAATPSRPRNVVTTLVE
jgi:hypothetical protein